MLFIASALTISMPSTAQNFEEIKTAAIDGNAKAQYQLAEILSTEAGKKSNPDFTEALEWLTKSSEQGYAEAQYNLGLIYFEDYLAKPLGLKLDVIKGLTLINEAANQGFPKAQSKLGSLYYYGGEVPQDYHKAFEWYLKAANQDDHYSQLRVASMYFTGQGVRQSYEKADEWRTRSAADGDPDHQ